MEKMILQKMVLLLIVYILFAFAKDIYLLIKKMKKEKINVEMLSTLTLLLSTWYVFLIFFQSGLGFNWFFNWYLFLISIILIVISGLILGILIFFPIKKII